MEIVVTSCPPTFRPQTERGRNRPHEDRKGTIYSTTEDRTPSYKIVQFLFGSERQKNS